MRLKEILQSGLWPYTPDPIPEGIYVIGNPPDGAPILMTANSRHTLGQLQRILSPIGGRVLAIDTGGVDVHSALASGRWSFEKIANALKAMDQQKDTTSQNAPGAVEAVEAVEYEELLNIVLPYPVWESLGGEEIGTMPDFKLIPGPANARDLPAYFARGCQITEDMKILKNSHQDRMQLGLAQAGMCCLVAALPMFFFGWQELITGITIMLIGVILFSALYPYVPGKNFWLKRILLILGLLLFCGILGWILGLSPLAILSLGLANLVGTGWTTLNIDI